jgi:hypothetical protein
MFYSEPVVNFLRVFTHIELYGGVELGKLVNFSKVKIPWKDKEERELFKYQNIKLTDIPGQRMRGVEMFSSFSDKPFFHQINLKNFYKKMEKDEQLTEAELEYAKFIISPEYEEYTKIRDIEMKYDETICGLKKLYERNKTLLEVKTLLASSGGEKDLFELPNKEAEREFRKRYISFLLTKYPGDKESMLKHAGRKDDWLRNWSKKLGLRKSKNR